MTIINNKNELHSPDSKPLTLLFYIFSVNVLQGSDSISNLGVRRQVPTCGNFSYILSFIRHSLVYYLKPTKNNQRLMGSHLQKKFLIDTAYSGLAMPQDLHYFKNRLVSYLKFDILYVSSWKTSSCSIDLSPHHTC
jgi:hypothetical protein